jgi:hypothetical protein
VYAQDQLHIPAVWVHTSGDGMNRVDAGPAWMSPADRARLERVRAGRLLFDGKHADYFLREGRTQFDFPEVRSLGGRVLQLYLTYNVLGLISLKSADLLFGDAPILRAQDAGQQAALADLVERSNLHPLLYGAAVDASYEGEAFLTAAVDGGEVYLQQLPADEMFPSGRLLPSGQWETYERYRMQNVGAAGQPVWLVLQETYGAGWVRRAVWQVDEAGGKHAVALSSWPLPAGSVPLVDVEATGTPRNTVTWIPNLLCRGCVVSDYDGAVELQDALNAKNSQLGRVLLKHSDPKLAMPAEAFDDDGNVRADHDVFAFKDPNAIPQYVTWDAQLSAAMADRAFVLNQLLVRTETSAVLLGLKEGAAPDAYKKVRLESFNSLAKAQRKAAFWRAGIARAVAVAQDLERRLPGVRYARGPVAVQLRDGIPVDAGEQATTLATLRGAGLVSVERALEELLNDPAAVRKELARLNAAAATGSGNGNGTGDRGGGGGGGGSGAAAGDGGGDGPAAASAGVVDAGGGY